MIKNNIKNIIWKVILFIVLFAICIFINKNIIIKALYMDDLYNWSYFPGSKFLDFGLSFYSDTRYRPVFNIVQYFEYLFVGTHPIRFTFFNYLINTILAFFIFHFAKKLNAGSVISFIVSVLYLVSHFSYYQIGQAFGLLETEAQFFALLILYLCLKLIGTIDMKSNKVVTIFIFINFFLVSFTHERFLCLAPVILLSLIFAKGFIDSNNVLKQKTLSILIFALLIILIFIIRKISIGRIIPAGTGGTFVEETFNLQEGISNCFKQIAFIFGINIGPEYLTGIEFAAITNKLAKYLCVASICIILVTYIIYLIIKMHTKSDDSDNDNFITDIIFIFFIVMCIISTSVTIRIEMRFIYTSFTTCTLYLAYICGYIRKHKGTFLKLTFVVFTILFFIARLPIELKYRSNFNKIYCISDQLKMNSLYDNTIGKYGVDDILHNKKIYILNNFYQMTDYYATDIFKIYDKDNKGNKIIFISDITDLPSDANSDNTIVLMEDIQNNAYKIYNIE